MRAGRTSASTRSNAAQSGPWGPLAMVVRGWAARVSVSPLAMPIRLSPKSRATTISIRSATRSGMSGERGELAGFDAEQAERRAPTFLVRQVEDHALVGRYREPGIVEQLLLELAGFPTRVAQRDERFLRAGAGGHGGQH